MSAELMLQLEVQALYAEYAARLDAGEYELWLDLFDEDCRYQLVPRENHDAGLPLATMALESKGMLKDRIYGVTQTLFHAPYYQRHVIGPPRVQALAGGEIRAEANYLVVRTKRDEPSEVYNAGRYLDVLVRTPQGLRFREKRCVFDSELILNSVIYPI